MNDNDFGPMTSAENEISDPHQQISLLQQREQLLIMQKNELEKEFGQKRALFMEMFKQKEEENNKLKEDIQKLEHNLDEVKSEVTIKEVTKNDEIEDLYQKYQSEVSSLRHLMDAAVDQATQDVTSRYEEEQERVVKSKEEVEEKLQSLRAKVSNEKESFLSTVAKTLQKKVGSGLLDDKPENLEDSMKKAQEDAEALRSVVMPLEEELELTRAKLKESYQQLEKLKSLKGAKSTDSLDAASNGTVTPKMKELNHHLETEKASRTDLEMYVAVLNTQKNVLQEDADKLRQELQEVCQILDQEKREHLSLKSTWTMANDQFLESNRLLMADIKRTKSILSPEQQKKLHELQKSAEEEAADIKTKELSEKGEKDGASIVIDTTDDAALLEDGMKPSASNELLVDVLQRSMRSQSSSAASSLLDLSTSGLVADSQSIGEFDSSSLHGVSMLSEQQQKAITDPTIEQETSSAMINHARTKSEPLNLANKRVISEGEWKKLQKEVKHARERSNRPCDMCANYETQLQNVQEANKKQSAQLRTMERQLESERKAITQQEKYIEELENSIKVSSEQCKTDIAQLESKATSAEEYINQLRASFTGTQGNLQDQLKSLSFNREQLQKQLTRLQDDNDSLMKKHSKHSEQLQEEAINLPNNVEDLQVTVLRWREDLIAAKVAKEHTEETLRSEIMFLKDQILDEQQQRSNMEETLTSEVSSLHADLTKLQNVKTELDQNVTLYRECDNNLKETQAALQKQQAKSKLTISSLQGQLEEQSKVRNRLEKDVSSLKSRVQSSQQDLDNSEAVQRDFVKLSQSLQIQLERIRSSEQEVRWQHEDDVDECMNCKHTFTVTKRKHHCRHCGKVFCSDCVTKNVVSGPKLRPSRVCDVCHTILVQDAQPYFSNEPPMMPT